MPYSKLVLLKACSIFVDMSQFMWWVKLLVTCSCDACW